MRFAGRVITVLVLCASALGATVRNRASGNSGDRGYLFPTDASHQINSGFADYRDTHFHGGIDISTNGKIGYPVYASKSGYVYRVSVSPFGYGKRIVLRHDDSTFTLYAHLSSFSEEIEKRVEAAQDREGKYEVDLRFRPGEMKVTRGEVIARTGATGVGGPHLHFEIHAKDYSFVDPLIYKSLDIRDRLTPRIYGVGIRDFFSDKAHMYGVGRLRDGYRARTTFRTNEPFFFIIHAADSYGRGRYKRPPKHIDLRIDGKEYLSLNLTRINADDYLDVSSLVDLRLSRGYKTYYKLCVDRAIPFPVFTPSAPLSGLVYNNFRNGTHTYEITVSDENGNTTSVTGRFVLNISKGLNAKASISERRITIKPFAEETVEPMPGLTLRFPANAFVKDVHPVVRRISSTAFIVRADGESLRKKIWLTWKVNDSDLLLYRKGREGWEFIPCKNNGKTLTARIGYETGEFALLRDTTPPVVGKIRVSRRNPYYKSVAPTQFNRDFVYFKVFDKLSGINTDNILLKVGSKQFLCEYDVDKHAATCRVDDALLRLEKRVEVVVHDNAGNTRTVRSGILFR